MKLSERIKEGERIGPLLARRTSAVRTLRDIDEQASVDVGGEYEQINLAKGELGFDAVRGAVLACIGQINDQLRAEGIEIDLDETETGRKADEELDADESEVPL
jgi:hypothetical protein